MYTNKSTVSTFPRKKRLIAEKRSSVKSCCATLDSVDTWRQRLRFLNLLRHLYVWSELFDGCAYIMYLILRYHDDHVASNNAALSNLRRNNRHPSFAFPRTKLVLRRYEMFKPYLVYRLLPSSLSHSQWTLDMRLSEPQRQQWLPIGREWMWRRRKTNYCKCTHCMLCLIIMCNVAALTFYATIYEDICCICNKSREKHVLGTASTAGSLCFIWSLSVGTSRPGQVRGHNLQSLWFEQNNNLTRFVLYASVVLVHQSCSSFIVLVRCFIVIMFHLS